MRLNVTDCEEDLTPYFAWYYLHGTFSFVLELKSFKQCVLSVPFHNKFHFDSWTNKQIQHCKNLKVRFYWNAKKELSTGSQAAIQQQRSLLFKTESSKQKVCQLIVQYYNLKSYNEFWNIVFYRLKGNLAVWLKYFIINARELSQGTYHCQISKSDKNK